MRQADADEMGQRDHHIFESGRVDFHLASDALELPASDHSFFHLFPGLPVVGKHVDMLVVGSGGKDEALHVVIGNGEGQGLAACGLVGGGVAVTDGGKLAVKVLRVIIPVAEDVLEVLCRQIGKQHSGEDVLQPHLRLSLLVPPSVGLRYISVDAVPDQDITHLHGVLLADAERIPQTVCRGNEGHRGGAIGGGHNEISHYRRVCI